MSVYRGRNCNDQVGGVDDMKNGKNNRRNRANFVDFEYDQFDPNIFIDNFISIPVASERPVAFVTLNNVQEGNLVWLNGVFGLDNDSATFSEVIIRVYRGQSMVFRPDQVIYEALVELDADGDGDVVNVPLAHVDKAEDDERNVNYTVTLEADSADVFLVGPLTFTATLIDKD